MSKPALFCVAILIATNLYSQSADEFTALAKKFEKEGDIDQAVIQSIKAMEASKEWRKAYDLGELLIKKTERWQEAIDAFTEAAKRGYDKPIIAHQHAMCYMHLKNYDLAIQLFERSIQENKALLKKLEKSGKDAEAKHARFQIGDSYLQMGAVYNKLERFDKLYECAVECEKYDNKNQFLQNSIFDGNMRMIEEAIARGELDKALEYCREGEKIVKRFNFEPDARMPRPTFSEVIENRIRLGKITPVYTHRIMAVYFNNLKSEFTLNEKTKQVDRQMNDREKRTAIIYQKVITMIYESISEGKFSLSWDSVNIHEPITQLKVDDKGDQVEPIWSSNAEFSKMILARARDFDTFFLVWNGQSLEATGGGGRPVPEMPIKGTVRIHPEHTAGIWMHEFFHVVEQMVGIKYVHGYYKENRGNFPDWKGPDGNQLDYYRWHFATDVKAFGWGNLKF